jgi:hypothetical protein
MPYAPARRTPSGPVAPKSAPPAVGNRPPAAQGPSPAKPDADVLFQTYFKSVGPRTYAAQVKRASNGNHFVVLTEGKKDPETGEPRKIRLFVFSEDFKEFFKMLQETAIFIRENPVPEEIKNKRAKFWAKNRNGASQRGPLKPAVRPGNDRA